MGWQEHEQKGLEVMHWDYWGSPEGVQEGSDILIQRIQEAMAEKGGLWKLVKPGTFAWYPHSPIECSCGYGFTDYLGEFRYKEEDVDKVEELLKKFDTRTIIASMVLTFHHIGTHDLIGTAAEKKEIDKIDESLKVAMTYAQSQNEAILNMATLLSETNAWQLLQSIEGRVEFFIKPVQKLIENPVAFEKAIERVRTDWGGWNQKNKICPFNVSVVLSLRHLFQDKLTGVGTA